MGIEIQRGFFKTRDEVLDDIKKTGFWPSTYVAEPSPPLSVHWHDLDVHGYILEGRTWFLDGESSEKLDVEPGDKIVIRARTLHAEGETRENVTMILALSEPGPFKEFLEQLPPETLG
jgi:mannose-6-phosphate isomerase-like protein (cupin superfamily)